MKRALLLVFAACGVEQVSSVQQAATTKQCPMAVVEGLDVYNGTGTIDWTMVAASGRQFAFIKATQGDYNKQTSFATNWAAAKNAGLLRSAYHFFDPTIDGVTQANAFLTEVTAGGDMTSADLPPMLDIECPVAASQSTSTSQGPNCEYTGNSGWVDTTTMQQRIFDWLSTVETATGRKPVIYSYPAWFTDVQFSDARLTAYPLFIATYSTCASVPSPWTSAVFWQYSATATVPGISGSGNVDVDRFFGSSGDLATWNAVPADAGVIPDADTITKPDSSGCGCHSGNPSNAWPALLVLLVVVRRRRSAYLD
jgi:lysozyme